MMQTCAKVLVFSSLLLILGSMAACEEGSYFDDNTKQLKNDKVGRLEAVGTDLRVYEFSPQTAPHIQCVFVAGEHKSGLQCWGKGIVNEDYVPPME